MKASCLFFQTSKQNSSDAEAASHKLLERGGFIYKHSKGSFSFTPLGIRVFHKFIAIIQEELNRIGGQELLLPLLQSSDLWKISGRWNDFVSENLLYTLKDREDREFCLAPTHEEVITAYVAKMLRHKKQLPLHLYQISQKFRDEIRPRFGLMRTKELIMEDSYTFSESPAQMQEQYLLLKNAYCRIFERIGVTFIIASADSGKIGKGDSEEFHVVCDVGEDAILVCNDYGVNVEAANAIIPSFDYGIKIEEKIEMFTPNLSDIISVSQALNIPSQKILKTLIYKLLCGEVVKFVAIGIRGDRKVNSTKVRLFFDATDAFPASHEEILMVTGCPLGFAGPLNCSLPFYADLSTQPMLNFACAANIPDIHFLNVNWTIDVNLPIFHDFLEAEAGDQCPLFPEQTYSLRRGVEVAHIFNLGTRYSKTFGACFTDESGEAHPCWMGTYGIGVGRTIAASVEQSYDEKGINWPLSLAPFKASVFAASNNQEDLVKGAKEIYQLLQSHGHEILWDDRDERMGFKIKDSDLIGLPYKIIVGKSFINGSVEIESRAGIKEFVEIASLLPWASSRLVP
ncbi:Proline--tRNA ligase [Candidatus Clavichlamydia salmonicola]|uniref:proline--tRNA ligase n=1 Tax=Candidatus Clavichlamydia salmonicola TaxID=469812 RepID=UPI001890DC94|nr:proline--tRNA ligase [Candidatus Clavichlamydia salmonicola]MBF5051083.1 Proline--tRNA ligase [Candidatus Clavichlamydia salmonicola]